jgi:SAM-dependent methyltransferase
MEGRASIHYLYACAKDCPRIQTTNMSESFDSAWPDFWNQRYASGETPWTLHAIPAALCSFVKRRRRRGTVLIPGCGTDLEVFQFFQTAGFEVTAIDFSSVAVAQTRKALRNFDGQIIRGDFFKFDFQNRFDLIYERTFLCALHPRRWSQYAKRVAQLLRPRGKLAGIFFYGKEPEPPPYPLSEARAAQIFGKYFRLIRDVKVSDSVPMFAGMERWQEWQLRPGAPQKGLRAVNGKAASPRHQD